MSQRGEAREMGSLRGFFCKTTQKMQSTLKKREPCRTIIFDRARILQAPLLLGAYAALPHVRGRGRMLKCYP